MGFIGQLGSSLEHMSVRGFYSEGIAIHLRRPAPRRTYRRRIILLDFVYRETPHGPKESKRRNAGAVSRWGDRPI